MPKKKKGAKKPSGYAAAAQAPAPAMDLSLEQLLQLQKAAADHDSPAPPVDEVSCAHAPRALGPASSYCKLSLACRTSPATTPSVCYAARRATTSPTRGCARPAQRGR